MSRIKTGKNKRAVAKRTIKYHKPAKIQPLTLSDQFEQSTSSLIKTIKHAPISFARRTARFIVRHRGRILVGAAAVSIAGAEASRVIQATTQGKAPAGNEPPSTDNTQKSLSGITPEGAAIQAKCARALTDSPQEIGQLWQEEIARAIFKGSAPALGMNSVPGALQQLQKHLGYFYCLSYINPDKAIEIFKNFVGEKYSDVLPSDQTWYAYTHYIHVLLRSGIISSEEFTFFFRQTSFVNFQTQSIRMDWSQFQAFSHWGELATIDVDSRYTRETNLSPELSNAIAVYDKKTQRFIKRKNQLQAMVEKKAHPQEIFAAFHKNPALVYLMPKAYRDCLEHEVMSAVLTNQIAKAHNLLIEAESTLPFLQEMVSWRFGKFWQDLEALKIGRVTATSFSATLFEDLEITGKVFAARAYLKDNPDNLEAAIAITLSKTEPDENKVWCTTGIIALAIKHNDKQNAASFLGELMSQQAVNNIKTPNFIKILSKNLLNTVNQMPFSVKYPLALESTWADLHPLVVFTRFVTDGKNYQALIRYVSANKLWADYQSATYQRQLGMFDKHPTLYQLSPQLYLAFIDHYLSEFKYEQALPETHPQVQQLKTRYKNLFLRDYEKFAGAFDAYRKLAPNSYLMGVENILQSLDRKGKREVLNIIFSTENELLCMSKIYLFKARQFLAPAELPAGIGIATTFIAISGRWLAKKCRNHFRQKTLTQRETISPQLNRLFNSVADLNWQYESDVDQFICPIDPQKNYTLKAKPEQTLSGQALLAGIQMIFSIILAANPAPTPSRLRAQFGRLQSLVTGIKQAPTNFPLALSHQDAEVIIQKHSLDLPRLWILNNLNTEFSQLFSDNLRWERNSDFSSLELNLQATTQEAHVPGVTDSKVKISTDAIKRIFKRRIPVIKHDKLTMTSNGNVELKLIPPDFFAEFFNAHIIEQLRNLAILTYLSDSDSHPDLKTILWKYESGKFHLDLTGLDATRAQAAASKLQVHLADIFVANKLPLPETDYDKRSQTLVVTQLQTIENCSAFHQIESGKYQRSLQALNDLAAYYFQAEVFCWHFINNQFFLDFSHIPESIAKDRATQMMMQIQAITQKENQPCTFEFQQQQLRVSIFNISGVRKKITKLPEKTPAELQIRLEAEKIKALPEYQEALTRAKKNSLASFQCRNLQSKPEDIAREIEKNLPPGAKCVYSTLTSLKDSCHLFQINNYPQETNAEDIDDNQSFDSEEDINDSDQSTVEDADIAPSIGTKPQAPSNDQILTPQAEKAETLRQKVLLLMKDHWGFIQNPKFFIEEKDQADQKYLQTFYLYHIERFCILIFDEYSEFRATASSKTKKIAKELRNILVHLKEQLSEDEILSLVELFCTANTLNKLLINYHAFNQVQHDQINSALQDFFKQVEDSVLFRKYQPQLYAGGELLWNIDLIHDKILSVQQILNMLINFSQSQHAEQLQLIENCGGLFPGPIYVLAALCIQLGEAFQFFTQVGRIRDEQLKKCDDVKKAKEIRNQCKKISDNAANNPVIFGFWQICYELRNQAGHAIPEELTQLDTEEDGTQITLTAIPYVIRSYLPKLIEMLAEIEVIKSNFKKLLNNENSNFIPFQFFQPAALHDDKKLVADMRQTLDQIGLTAEVIGPFNLGNQELLIAEIARGLQQTSPVIILLHYAESDNQHFFGMVIQPNPANPQSPFVTIHDSRGHGLATETDIRFGNLLEMLSQVSAAGIKAEKLWQQQETVVRMVHQAAPTLSPICEVKHQRSDAHCVLQTVTNMVEILTTPCSNTVSAALC